MNYLSKIQDVLEHHLPGEEAHLELSPLGRQKSSEALKYVSHYKTSAVAIVLFEKKNQLHTFLTERNAYNGSHSGQICFPGGKAEESDTSFQFTAERECFEETGLSPIKLNVLGSLTPVYIPVSNHYVHPYVFFHEGLPQYTIDPYEVKELFDFPIAQLNTPNSIKKTTILLEKGRKIRNVPYYAIHQKIVWGATGIILNEFKEVCKIAGVI